MNYALVEVVLAVEIAGIVPEVNASYEFNWFNLIVIDAVMENDLLNLVLIIAHRPLLKARGLHYSKNINKILRVDQRVHKIEEYHQQGLVVLEEFLEALETLNML